MATTVQHPRKAAKSPLRLAVYHPAPAGSGVLSLVRQFGAGVRARIVDRPQEVRATDDLVVVVAGADGFARSLTAALGGLAPPVLVVVRRGDVAGLPTAQAAGYLIVDRLDGLAASAVSFAVRATARRPAFAAAPTAAAPAEPLTPRERDIMALLAAGCSTREIADDLAITGKTVRNYLSNIYRKLGARRQAEALVRWLSSAEAQAPIARCVMRQASACRARSAGTPTSTAPDPAPRVT